MMTRSCICQVDVTKGERRFGGLSADRPQFVRGQINARGARQTASLSCRLHPQGAQHVGAAVLHDEGQVGPEAPDLEEERHGQRRDGIRGGLHQPGDVCAKGTE